MSGYLFVANLVATVVALVFTLHAGARARRLRHYGLAILTVVLLGFAIFQAELYGRTGGEFGAGFEFESWRLSLHLVFAFSALGVLPGVAVTGVGLAQGRIRRVWHKRFVWVFVATTVLAMATAGFMFLNAKAKMPPMQQGAAEVSENH